MGSSLRNTSKGVPGATSMLRSLSSESLGLIVERLGFMNLLETPEESLELILRASKKIAIRNVRET